MSTLEPRTVRILQHVRMNPGVTLKTLANRIGEQEGKDFIPEASVRRDIQTLRRNGHNIEYSHFARGYILVTKENLAAQEANRDFGAFDPCQSYADPSSGYVE